MAEIKRNFKVVSKEANIEHNGASYLVIYGKHINGGFCSFPKLNIATELSAYDGDYGYNTKKLLLVFSEHSDIDSETVSELARVITDAIQVLPDPLPF